MAARVNKKVVIPLLVTLTVVVGAAVAASLFFGRTSEYYKTKGDAAAAAEDWTRAEEFYSKAVFKDQGNLALLDLWRDSIARIVPEDAIKARDLYTKWSSILKRKTEIRPFEPQFHVDWLTHVLSVSLPEPSSADAAFLMAETENMVRSRPSGDSDPLWERAQRFRGIAGAYRMREAGLESRLRDEARADLQQAVAADPTDSLAVDALIRWHLYDASDLAGRSKSREALARAEEARSVAQAHLAKHPDDVLIAHALAETHLATATYERDLPDVSTDAMVEYRRALARAEELALASQSIEWWKARRLANDLLWVAEDRAAGVARAAELIEHALKGDPNHPQLRFERARFLAMAGRRDEAMKSYQELIDSPNLPVSLKSVQLFATRPLAALAQFEMDVDQWTRADRGDGEAVAKARAQAKARLDLYRSLVSDADENLHYVEGRFALADRRPAEAASRLNQFLTMVGRRPIPTSQRLAALLDLASALEQTNQPGSAFEYLEQAAALTGFAHPPILESLIALDLAGQNLERAERNLARLQEVAPGSAAAGDLRRRLDLARGQTDAATVDDPVMAAILRARDLAVEGQIDQARAALLGARGSAPENLGLLYELARLEHLQDRKAEALRYADEALALLDAGKGAVPEAAETARQQWRLLRALLNDEDLQPILEEIVDSRPALSPIDNHLEKWRLFNAHGLKAPATAHLDAARSIDARHPAILEHDFLAALASNDLEAARRLTQAATEANADLASGLTFRGRLELHTGKTTTAIATLIQAANLKPYDSVPWRLLGVAHLSAGNLPSAAEAFEKSLQREPTNVLTLRELAKLQFRRGDLNGALASIRKARALAPADENIHEAWLDLEGRHGDRPRAIQIRQRQHALASGGALNPAQLDNALSLVDLYELDGDFAKADALLSSLNPTEAAQRLRVATARADWHLKQEQIDAGRDALLAFTRTNPPPDNQLMTSALIALTQYFVDASRTNDAIETARSAIPFQDPVRREADRCLGEIYLALTRVEEALECYERALSGGADNPALSIQMVNLHLVLSKRDQTADPASAARHRDRAGALLDDLEKSAGVSLETMLLRGELHFQSGDLRAAERAFNEAVAAYPQDPRSWSARARFNLTQIADKGEIERAPRVRADVDQAMQISPGSEAPLLILADLARSRRHPQTGRPDPDVTTLISTWRRILEVNPRNEEVRSNLVELLYSRREYTQAQVLIQEAINLDPKRGAWHEIQGDLERNLGSPPEQYANHYGLAFEKQPSANRLLKLGRAWLAVKPPRAAQVIALYRQFEKEVGGLPSHRLLLAQAQALSGDGAAGSATLREAATMILAQTDPAARDDLLQQWFEALRLVATADRFAALAREAFGEFDDPWPEALLGQALVEAAGGSGAADGSARRGEGISRMNAARDRIKVLPRGEERTIRLQRELGWNLAGACYAAGDFAAAADAWRWVLEVEPDHFATLNNLAYALANDLDRPEEALDYARRAYEASPTDPTMLDTYGYVLFRNGRLEEAERTLRDSLNRADQSGARMHLGEVLAARGNVEEARRELNRARTLAVQQNQTRRVAEIDEVLGRLP